MLPQSRFKLIKHKPTYTRGERKSRNCNKMMTMALIKLGPSLGISNKDVRIAPNRGYSPSTMWQRRTCYCISSSKKTTTIMMTTKKICSILSEKWTLVHLASVFVWILSLFRILSVSWHSFHSICREIKTAFTKEYSFRLQSAVYITYTCIFYCVSLAI